MSRKKRTTIAISLLLVFATTQVYLATSFARDTTRAANAPQQVTGVLSTQGNQPITVNGVSTNAGATILTGANIETPAGVGATIDFGPLGSLQIYPGARVIVEFQNGMIKVTLLQGCVRLTAKRGTRGEIDRTSGGTKTTDGSKDDTIGDCVKGPLPPPTDGSGGLGAKVLVPAFVGTGAVLTWLALRGNNPSQTTP